MGWKCYSCGTVNSKNDASCTQCGNTVAAPADFYFKWIPGAAIFFMIFYLAGTMAGGVLVEALAAPSEADILKVANEKRPETTREFTNLLSVPFEEATVARAVATQRGRDAMSPILKAGLKWIFPIILFVLCGLIVGFISDGKTIWEPAIGSALGQLLAVLLIVYVFKTDASSWMAFAIGVLPGVGLAILGAFLGEIIQEKKERAGSI